MDIGQVLSLRFFFPIKTQKRTRSISCYLITELAWSIKDSTPSCCFVFSLLCLPVFVEKCILETHRRSSILREKSQKIFLRSRKIFSKRKFCAFAWTTTKFIARTIRGIPSGQYRSISPTRVAHWRSQSYSWFSLT